MKKTNCLLLFAFCLLLASCYEQEQNCKDFKTGKFESEITIKGVKKPISFVRDEHFEIDTFDGKTDTATVRWVNDCEYITQKIHPKTMLEKKAISCRILTTSKNSYTFEFGAVGEDAKQKAIVTKLN